MILYQLWVNDRACVLTFSAEAARLFKLEGGRVTETPGSNELEDTILEADKTVADWLSRYLAAKALDREKEWRESVAQP